MGNQFGFYEGVPLHYQDYDYEPDISQQILKNGLKIARALGPNTLLDVNCVHTYFLKPAAIDNYFSPGAGISAHAGSWLYFRLGYSADLTPTWRGHNATLTVRLKF